MLLRTTALLIICSVRLPASDFNIEPKRPLSAAEELKIIQTDSLIRVAGETFSYAFRKDNGLIGSVEVLGREITGGTPLPDLAVAENLDSHHSRYLARNETSARIKLAIADAQRVVLEAEGGFVAQDGRRFPLRYAVSYDISIDGIVLIKVVQSATGPCSFRWLTLSSGSVRRDRAKFLNWMPDQAFAQTTNYSFRALHENDDVTLLSGTWIPWIWIGDQTAGLEVTTWDVNSQTYNQVDSTARRDEPAMFSVRREGEEVRWDNFLVRRTRVDADRGWSRAGSFALAVTPSRRFDPYYSLFKGAHLGPHQHVTNLTLPREQEIRTLAQNGYNLVVGMANWRSGEYVPLNESELRETISLCHKYGLKIIPYVTLVDLAHSTPEFRAHGEEWAIEPTTEFIHHLRPDNLNAELSYRNNSEDETTLMCPGAAGWREHWKRQIDRIVRDYDFDGIYFDFWYGRMACENTRHGCGGRFRRATVLGSREMLMYAYNRLKTKNPRAIIKANTNTLATALITSLVDLRLVGEAIDATGMDDVSRRWLNSSYRLGETTEFLWDQTSWSVAQKAAFAALVNFLPQRYERPRFEPRTAFDDFDVFRSFDDGRAKWHLAISGSTPVLAAPPDVVVNVVERGGERLTTVVNTRASELNAAIPLENGWVACEPLTSQLWESAGKSLEIRLDAGAYRHLLVVKKPQVPKLLYALGSRTPARQSYQPASRTLQITADGVDGAKIAFGIYSPLPVRGVAGTRTGKLPFVWRRETKMLTFDAIYLSKDAIEISFDPAP